MSEPGELQDPLAATAFAENLRRLQWPLLSFVRGMTTNVELARDLVQDVFVDAWRLTRRGVPPFTAASDDESRRRWLFHAAHWRVVTEMRRAHAIHWEPLDSPASLGPARPDDAAQFEDRVADREAVRQALAMLPTEEAASVLLHVVQGFTSVELAQLLGISPEAARKRIGRAMQRLRAAYLAQNSASPSVERSHP